MHTARNDGYNESLSNSPRGKKSADRVTQLKSTPGHRAHMLQHAKLFALAVKNQVPALRDLAKNKFQYAISSGWNHESLGQVITLVFSSMPEDAPQLRDIVATALTENEKLLDKLEIEAAVCSINTLAYRLLKMRSAA